MPKSKLSGQDKIDAANLARKVKQLRIANHLTQADVARELSVSPGFISNVENGRTAMSLRLLIYYAKLTGTTLDMLVGDMIPEYRDDALDHAVMDAVKAELEQPEQAASMERLPETIAQLRGLIQTLGDNQNVLDDLSSLQSSRVTDNLRTVMGVAQKYAGLQSLNAAQQQNLSFRMQAWLAFGEEYDIFTQRTDAMTSSVTFVYKVASIGG